MKQNLPGEKLSIVRIVSIMKKPIITMVWLPILMKNMMMRYRGLKKYLTITDINTSFQYYITQIKFIKKEYQGVIDYAVPVIEQKSIKNKADINQLIGQSYFELENFEESVKYLEEYESKAKNLTKEDYYQLGFAQYQTGNYEGAVKSFKELNHINNALAQNALFLTGKAYLALKDKENARTALQRASTLKYDATIIEEAKFNYAKLSYELGYNNDALVAIRKFMQTYPNSKYTDEANEILADVLLQTKNYDEALAIIDQLDNPSTKIKGAYQIMAYHKGISLYNSGKLNQALQAFNKAQRYTNDKSIHALTQYWRGDIFHRKNNIEKSIPEMTRFLSSAVNINADHTARVTKSTGHYVQGYNYYKQKNYPKAQQEFEQTVNGISGTSNQTLQKSILPDALLRTADCYFIQKNYSASINYYDKVINKAYDGTDYAYYQKGIINGLQGKYAEKNQFDAENDDNVS